jgi:hypothetical protein
VSVAFLVQRSIPLQTRGRYASFVAWCARSRSKRRRFLVWIAQSSMQLAKQVRDPLGIVLGTSDRAASSRPTAAWISLIIRCLRAECRLSPVPCLRAM